MKTKSIYLKNFMFLCGMVLMSFLIFGITFVLLLRNYMIDERKDSMRNTAQQISNFLSAYRFISSDELNMQLNIFMKISGNNIIITYTDGEIAYISDNSPYKYIGQYIGGNVLETVESDLDYSGQSTLGGFYSTNHYIVACPLDYIIGGKEVCLILTYDTSTFVDLWGRFATMFIFVGTIVVAISFFIAMFMAKWQTAPMRTMSVAANKFAHGDFTARVEVGTRFDELGELINSFNAMADALEKSENQRREFIANVSHELKTPMTSINGFAEGILDGTIPEERQEEYLQIIASETKRLSRLVRSMLDSSKIQAMDKEEVLSASFDISEVLRRVLLGNENRINQKNLDVEAEIPDEPVMVRGQEDSIMQVVNNLLDNAIKFADEGGTIGLKLTYKDEKIFIAVKNTGECIAKEELPLIFDRFHKTDKSRSLDKDGVGLGLHIVKMLINNHGENIYVKSENNVTEFLFSLAPDDRV